MRLHPAFAFACLGVLLIAVTVGNRLLSLLSWAALAALLACWTAYSVRGPGQ